MSALESLAKIAKSSLVKANLRYCFMDFNKLPHKVDGSMAHSNENSDFVSLEEICQCKDFSPYKTLAISIWASNICAIDIDHCVTKENDLSSLTDIGKDIFEMFKDFAYIEFSFSGTGLRMLFRQNDVQDYVSKYYIKNSKFGIEYYQQSQSARYVSVTGNTIVNNNVDSNLDKSDVILKFLDKYMVRQQTISTHQMELVDENRSIDELKTVLKRCYMKDFKFQNLWFGHAPGSGSNESELDYQIMCYLFENVTEDKDKLRELFETSPYYQSKDWYHKTKWSKMDYRYFNTQYNAILKSHIKGE